MTQGQFPQERPSEALSPPPPNLKRPETAVYSYLLWISYAYRILNSGVASATFDPYEEVRVDSYVEFNRQQKRALDQRLVGLKIKSTVSKGDTATVTTREDWLYRYIDIDTVKYNSPVNSATYDTTYTVVRRNGNWVVNSVVASSTTPLK